MSGAVEFLGYLRSLPPWLIVSIKLGKRRVTVSIANDECRGENGGANTSRVDITWDEIEYGGWRQKIDAAIEEMESEL